MVEVSSDGKKMLVVIPLVFFALFAASVTAYITGLSYENIRIENDKYFNSEAMKMWVIDWTAGGTDYIEGWVEKSEFLSETGNEAKEKFKIKMSTGEEWAKYSYQYERPLREIELTKYSVTWPTLKTWDEIAEEAGCVDFDGDGLWDGATGITSSSDGLTTTFYNTIWCAKWGGMPAKVYSIYQKLGIWSIDWELQPEGKPKVTASLSNDAVIVNGSSTWLQDRALIKWYGSIEAGPNATLPEYSGIRVVWILAADSWRLVKSTQISEQYFSYLRGGGLETDIYHWKDGEKWKETVELEVHNRINSAIIRSLGISQFPGYLMTYYPDDDEGGGYFRLEREGVHVPSFVVYVDADYLEIVIPAGEPEILDITAPIFEEDNQGKIFVKVMNKGDHDGDFELGIVGVPEHFSATGQLDVFTLAAHMETTRTLFVSGSSDELEDTCGTFTIQLRERTLPNIQGVNPVSDTVEVCFYQTHTCEPGNTWKSIEDGVWVVWLCHEDGLTKEIILRCKEGEIAEYIQAKWQCSVTPEPGPGPGPGPTPPGPTPTPEECDTSKCSWWDWGCFIYEGLICPIMQLAKNVFMWIGIGIVVIILLVIVIKVVFKKSPREYIPYPRPRRGYVPYGGPGW